MYCFSGPELSKVEEKGTGSGLKPRSFKVKFIVKIDPRAVHVRNGWWFPEKPAPVHGCFQSDIKVVLDNDQPRESICESVPCRATLFRIYSQSGV